ncbi:sigma-E factor regulatory protein RseB domain-containing protein [Phytoactinopolyspora limicola]|uniref:sigma-E factor regulatory protein RseB domain-containing protein n=1 Tax=Phytoactinopolyspora limicola TaxID=2715536 RepID=UPI00140C238F|nr:sigma-E factor regulatory protein RseB domain-containing protein [Phytoactinopolyspora limicola]
MNQLCRDRLGDRRTIRPRGSLGLLAAPMLLGALILLLPPATAAAGPDNLAGTDDQRAVELLARSAAAPQQTSYHGTQYVSAWSVLAKTGASKSAVVQVRHQAGGATEIGLQNTQTSILQGRDGTTWLADGGGPIDLLIDTYDVRMAGEGQVAGRAADVVEAVRADGSIAARLWLDRQTSLSLRREAYTHDGHLLSASAFVEISLAAVPPCCLRSGMQAIGAPAPTHDQAVLRWDDIERLRDQGYHCMEELADGFVLYEARQLGDAVQLSYSDGVMSISVFEQPGRLDPGHLEGYVVSEVGDGFVYASPGPPARFTWSSQGRVITVVADAPLEMVDGILAALPPDGPEPEEDNGVISRIGRGAQKVGTWLNPFN